MICFCYEKNLIYLTANCNDKESYFWFCSGKKTDIFDKNIMICYIENHNMMMIFCYEENLIYLTASPILSLSVVFGPDACTHCQWWRLALIEMERMRRMVMRIVMVMEVVECWVGGGLP